MRWIMLIGLVSVIGEASSQEQHFWIEDTLNVRTFINVYESDTSYYPKNFGDHKECYIYYDVEKKHKAAYYKYGKFNCDIDSVWFRNGNIKKWSNTVPDCSVCRTLREFYISGRLKMECNYAKDTCVWIHYYESGQLQEINKDYRNPGGDGYTLYWHYSIQYYENGQRKFDAVDPNRFEVQPYNNYNESGKLKSKSSGYGHACTGPDTGWYENGRIQYIGQHSEIGTSKLGLPQSFRIGTWSYYNESGKLIKEEFYEQGKLVKTIEY